MPVARLESLEQRLDKPIAMGNEGPETIVAAGRDVSDIAGKRCAGLLFSGMFAVYRTEKAADVMILPDDIPPAEAVAMFVNPLTALRMVETMRREGHSAIVRNAAASNLSQMLVRLCRAEQIGLVNIVRREDQATLLRELGAEISSINRARRLQAILPMPSRRPAQRLPLTRSVAFRLPTGSYAAWKI